MWRFTLKYVDVAVHAFANEVGHVADGQEVGGAVQRDAVVEREALAGLRPWRESA